MRVKAIEGLIALLLSAVLTTLLAKDMAWPLDTLEVDRQGNTHDRGQMAWNLWHVAESAIKLENPFRADNIYYPAGASLGKHTLASGYLPLTLLVRLVTQAAPEYPVYAFNLAILVSFTLLVLFMYLALREVGTSMLAAAAMAVSFAFSDFFFLHYMHLNHLSAFFFPLCAMLLAKLIESPSLGRACGFSASLGLSVYFTEFAISLWLCFSLALVVFASLPSSRPRFVAVWRRLGVKNAIIAATVFALIVVPMAFIYLSSEANPPRASDFSKLSANLAGFVIPHPKTTPVYGATFEHTSSRFKTGLGGREVFLGFGVLLFSLFGLVRITRPIVLWGALTALVFLTLSLGPTLKLFETDTGLWLPYQALMKIPPFDQNRCPVRFALVALFALAFVAATGLTEVAGFLQRTVHRGIAWAVLVAVLGWSLAECRSPSDPKKRMRFDPPLTALAALSPGPVAVVPIAPKPCNQVLLQTVHGHPISNGCLARHAPEPLKLANELRHTFDRSVPEFGRLLERKGYQSILVIEPIPENKLEALRKLPLPLVVLDKYLLSIP